MILKKTFPASTCRKKKITCSTKVIEKNYCTAVKQYPTHWVARKKNLADHKSTTPPPPPQKLNGRPLSRGYVIKAIKLLKLSFTVTDINLRTLEDMCFFLFFVINEG